MTITAETDPYQIDHRQRVEAPVGEPAPEGQCGRPIPAGIAAPPLHPAPALVIVGAVRADERLDRIDRQHRRLRRPAPLSVSANRGGRQALVSPGRRDVRTPATGRTGGHLLGPTVPVGRRLLPWCSPLNKPSTPARAASSGTPYHQGASKSFSFYLSRNPIRASGPATPVNFSPDIDRIPGHSCPGPRRRRVRMLIRSCRVADRRAGRPRRGGPRQAGPGSLRRARCRNRHDRDRAKPRPVQPVQHREQVGGRLLEIALRAEVEGAAAPSSGSGPKASSASSAATRSASRRSGRAGA